MRLSRLVYRDWFIAIGSSRWQQAMASVIKLGATHWFSTKENDACTNNDNRQQCPMHFFHLVGHGAELTEHCSHTVYDFVEHIHFFVFLKIARN
jgi:hypothetical protein